MSIIGLIVIYLIGGALIGVGTVVFGALIEWISEEKIS